MHQVSFDTHAAARKLEQAGHSSREAEAVVEVVSEATRVHTQMAQDLERIKLQVENHMATKADIANMATKDDMLEIRAELANIREVVREVLREEAPAIHLRWLVSAGSLSLSLGGFALMVLTNERVAAIFLQHGALIGLMMIVVSSVVLGILVRQSST